MNEGSIKKKQLEEITKMKPSNTSLIVGIVIGFAVGVFAGRFVIRDRYEFHFGTGSAVGIIWRCDKRTGKADVSYGPQGWHTVKEATSKWMPPESDLIISNHSEAVQNSAPQK